MDRHGLSNYQIAFVLLIACLLTSCGINSDRPLQSTRDGEARFTIEPNSAEEWSVAFIAFGDNSTTSARGAGYILTTIGERTDAVAGALLSVTEQILLFDSNSRVFRYRSDGVLDTSFNTVGMIQASLGLPARVGILQTDGRVIAMGGLTSGVLYRYLTDGTLDSSFHSDGLVLVSGTTSVYLLHGLQQTDGRLLGFGASFGPSFTDDFLVAQWLTDGRMDTSFHTDGKAFMDLTNGGEIAWGGALQTDGKIISVGTTNQIARDGTEIAIARFLTDGNLDTAFHSDGIQQTAALNNNTAYRALIQTDGKILSIGIGTNTDTYSIAVRYLTNGSLDTTFHSDGILAALSGNAIWGELYDEKLMIFANLSGSGGGDYKLSRYLTDGTVDTTFGSIGMVIRDFSGKNDGPGAGAIQTDGRLLQVGFSLASGTARTSLVRYLTNGLLDTTFSSDGIESEKIGPFHSIQTLTFQNGLILGIGGAGDTSVAIARWRPNGALDTSFYTQGFLAGLFSGYIAYDGMIQTDGALVTVGGTSRFEVSRHLSGGQLDTTFHTDGIVGWSLSGSSRANAGTLQTDGRFVLAGAGRSWFDIAIVRLESNGLLDTSFHSDGKVLTSLSGVTVANDVLMMTDSKVLVMGYATLSNQDFAAARYLTDGNLDTTFDTDGKMSYSISGNERLLRGLLLSDGKYLGVGYTTTANQADFVLLRLLTDGLLDTTFNSNGTVVTNFSGNDYGKDLTLDGSGKIIVAGYDGSSPSRFVVMRYLTSGGLDTTFGTSGCIARTIAGGNAKLNATAINPTNGSIYVGGDFAQPLGTYGLLIQIAP